MTMIRITAHAIHEASKFRSTKRSLRELLLGAIAVPFFPCLATGTDVSSVLIGSTTKTNSKRAPVTSAEAKCAGR